MVNARQIFCSMTDLSCKPHCYTVNSHTLSSFHSNDLSHYPFQTTYLHMGLRLLHPNTFPTKCTLTIGEVEAVRGLGGPQSHGVDSGVPEAWDGVVISHGHDHLGEEREPARKTFQKQASPRQAFHHLQYSKAEELTRTGGRRGWGRATRARLSDCQVRVSWPKLVAIILPACSATRLPLLCHKSAPGWCTLGEGAPSSFQNGAIRRATPSG